MLVVLRVRVNLTILGSAELFLMRLSTDSWKTTTKLSFICLCIWCMTLSGKCTWPVHELFYLLACRPACLVTNLPTRHFLEFTTLMLLHLVLWVSVVYWVKLVTAPLTALVSTLRGMKVETGVRTGSGFISLGRQVQWLKRRTRTVTCFFVVRIVLAMIWRRVVLLGAASVVFTR